MQAGWAATPGRGCMAALRRATAPAHCCMGGMAREAPTTVQAWVRAGVALACCLVVKTMLLAMSWEGWPGAYREPSLQQARTPKAAGPARLLPLLGERKPVPFPFWKLKSTTRCHTAPAAWRLAGAGASTLGELGGRPGGGSGEAIGPAGHAGLGGGVSGYEGAEGRGGVGPGAGRPELAEAGAAPASDAGEGETFAAALLLSTGLLHAQVYLLLLCTSGATAEGQDKRHLHALHAPAGVGTGGPGAAGLRRIADQVGL